MAVGESRGDEGARKTSERAVPHASWLEVLARQWQGGAIELDGQRVSVGRGEDNTVVIDWDPEVSRAHAVIERVGAAWTIVDDGLSRNGTFVNTERIDGRRRLHHGDRIRVGRTLLAYHGGQPSDVETRDASDVMTTRITPAQRRVLIALCRPCLEGGEMRSPATNAEVSEELTLSIDGVRTHLKALFEEFGLSQAPQSQKRLELARRAIALGVVTRGDL